MIADPYRVLVLLPNDIAEEKLLAYCAALQSFRESVKTKTEGWNTIYKGQEKLVVPVELDITCTDMWHRHILQEIVLPHKLFFASPSRKGYNYVVDLRTSQEDALKYARTIHKHFSQILGIFIGADTSALPNVEHIPKQFDPKYKCDILLTPKMKVWIGAKLDDWDVVTRVIGKNDNFEQLCCEINSAKWLIGEVSLETYLASSFKIPVMEFTEESIGRTFLSKFLNPNYRQYIVKDNERCSDAFMSRLKLQWETISITSKAPLAFLV